MPQIDERAHLLENDPTPGATREDSLEEGISNWARPTTQVKMLFMVSYPLIFFVCAYFGVWTLQVLFLNPPVSKGAWIVRSFGLLFSGLFISYPIMLLFWTHCCTKFQSQSSFDGMARMAIVGVYLFINLVMTLGFLVGLFLWYYSGTLELLAIFGIGVLMGIFMIAPFCSSPENDADAPPW